MPRLHNGSKYQFVEVFYEPEELESLPGHQGWTARLDATRWFIFGEALAGVSHRMGRCVKVQNF
jgi:hypothetical protein